MVLIILCLVDNVLNGTNRRGLHHCWTIYVIGWPFDITVIRRPANARYNRVAHTTPIITSIVYNTLPVRIQLEILARNLSSMPASDFDALYRDVVPSVNVWSPISTLICTSPWPNSTASVINNFCKI